MKKTGLWAFGLDIESPTVVLNMTDLLLLMEKGFSFWEPLLHKLNIILQSGGVDWIALSVDINPLFSHLRYEIILIELNRKKNITKRSEKEKFDVER